MFIHQLSQPVRTGLILGAGVLVLAMIYSLAAVIAPFLLSIVLAYMLNPVVRWLEAKKIPRGYAVLLMYCVFALAGVLVVVPVSLSVAAEAVDLGERLATLDMQQIGARVQVEGRVLYERLAPTPGVRQWLAGMVESERVQGVAARAAVAAKDAFLSGGRSLMQMVAVAFSGLMGLLLIPLLTFYVLIDLDPLYDHAVRLVPPIYRPGTVRIMREIDLVLSGFLRGQMISCCIFAALMMIGLWLVGLHLSLLLGPLAGVANLVPYLGGVLTVVLSSLIALSQHGVTMAFIWQMVGVAVVLAVVQAVDGLVLQPRVIGESAGLHPVIVMLALVVGSQLYGLFGMLLAAPACCILKVLLHELYLELYDDAGTPSAAAGAANSAGEPHA